MSTATAERPTTTTEHPPERRAKLKRARMSEGTELTAEQAEAVDALPDKASAEAIEAAVTGKTQKGSSRKKGAAKPGTVKYPEHTREAYKAALKLTGTPDEGGPKYPLTVKQTAAVEKALASKAKSVAEANKSLESVSDAALRKIAKGKKDAPSEATGALRRFLNVHPSLKDDRTMYARKGAAIVLALRDQG